MSIVKKISQSLLGAANSLEDKKNKLQSYLDDRSGSLKKFANEILASDTVSGVNPNALSSFNSIYEQYKTRVDPRLVPEKTFDPNFDGVGGRTIITNDQYFTQLGTMDIWNATLQAKALNGLIGSKIPLLPMIFRVEMPPSAKNKDPVPDLTLFVNPSSWSRSISKVNQNQWTRKGIKTERWGEDLEQITARGQIGGFYTLQTGLTRTYRWQTPSFRNLMELVQIYKNNGCTYGKSYSDRSDFVAPSQNRILDVGFVAISYGYEVFLGNFESFDLNEADDKPFTVSYGFTFNCASVLSIHDLNPTTSKMLSQPQQSESVQLGQGIRLNGINDNVASSVSAIEAAMASSGEKTYASKPSALFTLPNQSVSNAPKDTLFPSLLSGVAKTDATKPYILEYGRSSVKVEFRDSSESEVFYKNLPQDSEQRLAYIQDFLSRQKNRATG